jgi:hypothetical protein
MRFDWLIAYRKIWQSRIHITQLSASRQLSYVWVEPAVCNFIASGSLNTRIRDNIFNMNERRFRERFFVPK